MSAAGGGSIILHARGQQVWTSPDLSITLTLHNETDSEVSITSDQCAAMVNGLAAGNYQTTWNGTSWSTPSV